MIGKTKYQRGFSTLEILIAFAILTLALTSVILVAFGNQSVSVDSQTNSEAIAKAQTQLEIMRATAKTNFSTINLGVYCDDSSATQCPGLVDSYYNRKITVTDCPIPDTNCKQVITDVTYSVSILRPQKVSLSTIVTDPQSALGGCSPTLSGDWTQPGMVSYEFGKDLLVPQDSSSGFPITSVQVFAGKLYVTVNNTQGNNLGTLFGFDISDPSKKPQFLFGIDNAPTVREGLNAIAVFGHYAYLANAYTDSSAACSVGTNCAQLQIVDLNDLAKPLVNVKIPATTSGGKLAYGTSIFYNKGYIYLGLAKASGSGSEFYIIDVGGGGLPASPTNPILKGNYPVHNGVNAIYVKDYYAYIASPNVENLTILDISNPLGPTRLTGYTPPGPLPDTTDGIGSDHGESVYIKDNTIYLGRTYGTTEFYMLNSPSASLIKSKDLGSGNGTSINGLIIRENLAFLITNSQFQIWNTSGSISQYASPLDLPGGSGTAIGCKGNYIYVGSLPSNNKGFISIVGPKGAYTLRNSNDISVIQGSTGSNTITRTLVSGFPPGETLSVSGLPAGATASWTNNPCTATCSSTLTIVTTFPTTPVGSYPITVKNPAGTVTTVFNLVVNQPFDYSLAPTSANISVNRGASVNNGITVTKIAGTAQAVTLTASGMQNGVTVTTSPVSGSCTPGSGTCSVVFTFIAASNAQKKKNTITINGTSPAHSTTFSLTVN